MPADAGTAFLLFTLFLKLMFPVVGHNVCANLYVARTDGAGTSGLEPCILKVNDLGVKPGKPCVSWPRVQP